MSYICHRVYLRLPKPIYTFILVSDTLVNMVKCMETFLHVMMIERVLLSFSVLGLVLLIFLQCVECSQVAKNYLLQDQILAPVEEHGQTQKYYLSFQRTLYPKSMSIPFPGQIMRSGNFAAFTTCHISLPSNLVIYMQNAKYTIVE